MLKSYLYQTSETVCNELFLLQKCILNSFDINWLQISEEENDINSGRKSLVTTQFVDWSCKYFAQPVMKFLEDNDVESNLHYEREWRYKLHESLGLLLIVREY